MPEVAPRDMLCVPMKLLLLLAGAACLAPAQNLPHAVPGGYELPNGWRITPLGKPIHTEDMLLGITLAPDGKAAIGLHSGFNPHGLVVVDPRTQEAVQRIPLKSAFLGLAWSPDGRSLYVSGGNATSRRNPGRAPIYVFSYRDGKLSEKPAATLEETIPGTRIYWAGLVHHPKKPLLFAANRGTGKEASTVVVFDTESRKLVKRIPVEVNPYAVVLSADARTLYVSNWASASVSIIDVEAGRVMGRVAVGDNPNDMELAADGRLFVACANDNSVVVIDTKTRQPVEKINTALYPRSPEGSTPNALALDRKNHVLFVANADNNDVAVVRVAKAGDSEVLGFLPAGWYPSALALDGNKLWVGNSKGMGSYSDERGPHSPLPPGPEGNGTVKSLQKGSINIVDLSKMASKLKEWTKQVYANCPYNDKLLSEARPPQAPSIVPHEVGVGSPIKHIIYIIKENRTYDQVLGDLGKGNGDPRITIFGHKVTPNQHAIAEQYVLFDNLYCDGEVSVDGHSWSNSAYATDYLEKLWPVTYGGHSQAGRSQAYVPSGGHMWDLAAKKGLTYRSYGEYATRASDGTTMEASPGVGGLLGHVCPKFKMPGMRDTDNVRVFLEEFEQYEKEFDNADPNRRLPNFIVMSLAENHTRGTTPGAFTPVAMVANNDWAVGQLVERVTKSKYWPETAIFIIEDDAQDGSDHVDARRTTGFAISPYIKRGTIDSTLYTTSAMLRTMQLLLGLPPMSQYDAAATPMYKAFGATSDLTGFQHIPPQVDVNAKNTLRSYGARESLQMDFSDVDRTDMFALNEVIWKSIRGKDSPMPVPVHRFRFEGR
jgi:YVTN family beta-propeller protein